MRILYGLASEGMGHAIRSKVVLGHLASAHDLMIVCAGKPYAVLSSLFPNVHEIVGTGLAYKDNVLSFIRTIGINVKRAPRAVPRNAKVLWRVFRDFKPDLVVTDFESLTSFYADISRTPLLSIDNMQIIDKCRIQYPKGMRLNYQTTRKLVHDRVPRADRYIISTFFHPPVKEKHAPRVSLVPPILRDAVLDAPVSAGDHVVVYQTSDSDLDLPAVLKTLPHPFIVYGFNLDRIDANLTFRSFSETGFIRDLASARALIAGGGFTTLTEALHLRKPILSVPIAKHFEQILNAFYVDNLGFGRYAPELTPHAVASFLDNLDRFAENLTAYPRNRNDILLAALEDGLDRLLSP